MIHEKIEIQLKDSEFKANLFTYFLDNSPEIEPERKRSVVLICPGGGYQMTSDREAEALDSQIYGNGLSCCDSALQRCSGTFPGGASSAGYSSCNAP